MADGGEEKSKDKDFYRVLGLNKECTASDLRNAYKKLAMRWHPDRCSNSGNSKLDESKKKFQDIQQAYSVLSDTNKRFLYDVGVYDSDDDENGMGDFLNEMAVMMTQTKPNDNGKETFEELQELFEEMFQDELDSFEASYQAAATSSSSSSFMSYNDSSSISNKRNSFEMSNGKPKAEDSFCSESHFQKFSLGVEHRQDLKKGKGARGGTQGVGGGRRRKINRKEKTSSGFEVSSSDFGISA